jgi:hypothetical protein
VVWEETIIFLQDDVKMVSQHLSRIREAVGNCFGAQRCVHVRVLSSACMQHTCRA